jgi:hypothetical protein
MENKLRFEIEFDGTRPSSSITKIMRLCLIVGSMVFGILWAWDNHFTTMFQNGSLPIVKASDMPMKIKPIHPGGMKIPYQHLGVYCRISRCEN